jgi:hypothetical protein
MSPSSEGAISVSDPYRFRIDAGLVLGESVTRHQHTTIRIATVQRSRRTNAVPTGAKSGWEKRLEGHTALNEATSSPPPSGQLVADRLPVLQPFR